MINLFKLFFVLFLFSSLALGGIVGDTFKGVTKVGAVYGAKKVLESEAGKRAVERVKKKILHKNSKEYAGESHVYRIKNKDGTYKIGESSQGKDEDGLSKRAEQQVRKLQKQTADSSYRSKIIKEFSSKKEARDYETKVIERMREFYGKDKNDKSVLVGNKTNR